MVERRLGFSELEIDQERIARCLFQGNEAGYHEEYVVTLLEKILADLSKLCTPGYGYKLFNVREIISNHLIIDNRGFTEFSTGNIISSSLAGSEKIAVFVSTAGEGFEKYLRSVKGNILNEFIADAVGSEIPEAVNRVLVTDLEDLPEVVTDNKKMVVSNPFSPGYCGWDVAEQQKLFSLLPPEPCGIKLNSSCLMTPLKSVSGIIAIGKEVKRQGYKCAECTMVNCVRNNRLKY
jgi:hypothetical protein